MDIITYYRKMKNHDRLNGKFKHREYNLIEHSYMVAMLFKNFASKEDISYGPYIMDLILHHDIVETVTIDLPYPVKNFSSKTKEAWEVIEEEILKDFPFLERYSDEALKEGMTELQHRLFKVCDLLDLWIFLKEEKAIGNNSFDVDDIINRSSSLIKGKFKSVDKFMEDYHA